MKRSVKVLFDDDLEEYEECWETGMYTDQNCEFCQHKEECSGYDDDDC